MKQLIVTGDDFGLDVAVNEAVEIAHTEGILSAASLMVAGQAAADAIARARRLPFLRVGLHLVLVEGRAVLPPPLVPDLVDAEGHFHVGLFAAGVRFFFRPGVRRQLAAEIEAQFAAFAATGLVLDHVNAHNHLHLHPTVLSIVLKVGTRHGVSAMRVPLEPVGWRRPAGTSPGTSLAWGHVASGWGTGVFALELRRRCRAAGLQTNDQIFGLADSGAMDEAAMLNVLRRLPDGITEIYCHPATRRSPAFDRYMAGYRPLDELAALTSPRVRARLEHLNLAPGGYRDLAAVPNRKVAGGARLG